MHRLARSLTLWLTAFLLTACGSIKTPRPVASKIAPQSHIHVVKHANSSRDIDVYLKQAFLRRGFVVTAGPREDMPASTDYYVEYVDRWTWDIVMYLVSLEVSLHEQASRHVVGNGIYRNSFFHTFPNPERMADRVVGRILGEAQ